jgi:hypothetical protein
MSALQAFTRLWTQHVVWTRQVIVSSLASLPDAPTAVARLMKNQEDIGAALGRIYGSAFGAAATQLLKEHIEISLVLVKAAAAGDAPEAERQWALWHDNADALGILLASANHAWSGMRQMLYDHLRLTYLEAAARIEHNWPADVTAFDTVLDQAFAMAEMMAAGLKG